MRLTNDTARCYGINGAYTCPSRETCARYCQLPLAGYNTPAHMHMCRTTGQTFAEHYIPQTRSGIVANQEARDGR